MKSIVLALVAILAQLGAAGAAESRPNFIVILIDDMGYADLGCYGGAAKTPQIDRLAREGIRFTQFYVAAPICSPSRCGLLTGQWPQRHRITSFLETREANERRGMAQWLDPAAPSLARVLHDAGYRTGHFGKWHLGGQRDVGEAPLISEYGFDASLTNFEGLGDRVLPIMGGFDGRPRQKLPLGLGSEKLGRGEIAWAPRHEVTARFVERAIAFIDESRQSKQPFYINLWPDDVHSPFSPPPGADADVTKATRYRAVLENLDRSLGVLFDRLRLEPDLLANTLVLLLSDNGPEPGAGQAGVLRGHKGLLYEGGIREPLIAWGGLISPDKRGTTDEASVLSTLDFFPSLTHLAGLPASKTCDGEDQSDSLTGRGTAKRRGPLLWKRPPDRPKDGDAPAPDLAIRSGDWKLLIQGDGSGRQLYDLKADPSESKNLAEEKLDIVSDLRVQLDDWIAGLP
jgi:arylsulfatase A-like enzyme